MNDFSALFVATLFILISLIALISAEPIPAGTRSARVNSQAQASEIGLFFTLKK